MKIWKYAIILLPIGGVSAFGQQVLDARAAGMAFSNGADTRGLQSVGLNPATLALPTPFRMEFNLFSLTVAVNNNSFTKSQYDRFFTTGNLLTRQDIDEILEAIPDGGLRADGTARVNTLSFFLPNFSLSLVGVGAGKARVPKTVFELPLRGNGEQPGRIYRFDDTEGSDWLGIGIFASGAYGFHPGENSPMDHLAVGLSLKYYSGLRFDHIERARGELRNFDNANNHPYIHIDGSAELISSRGGSGLGVDVGVIGSFEQRLALGITVLNIASTMSWGSQSERRLVSIQGDSLNLPERVSESLITDTDTSFSISSFATQLPVVMDFALAYHPGKHTTITAEYEQGLNDQMGGTRQPRVGVGMEFRGVPAIPLRTGFTFGGKSGPSFAFGAGLHLKNWYLDVAYLNHGRIIPDDYRGIGLAITSRLRF